MISEANAILQPPQYSPIAVANTFIELYGKDCPDLSHMKLQKLVYMVHGWWLSYFPNSPVINEKPQVWKFGPVFNSMYHILKTQGMRALREPQRTSPFGDLVTIKDNKTVELIDWVWNRYGSLSAEELSDMTHKDGTAWNTIAKEKNFRVPYDTYISDDKITQEFCSYKKEFGLQ